MGLADDNNNRGQQEQEELRRELDIIYPNALPAVIACTECLSTMQLERRERVRKEKKISFRCPRFLCRTWKSAQEIQKELGIPPVPVRWSDRKRSGVSTVSTGAPATAAAKKEKETKEEGKKKRGERKDKSTSISGDDAQYTIDKILAVRERVDEKTGEKLTEYRVRWENYTRNWDTWEVESAAFSKKIADFRALTPEQLAKLQYVETYGTSKKGPKEGHDDKVLVLGALFDNSEKGVRFTVRDADGDLVNDVSPEEAFKANGKKAIGFLMSEMKIGVANKKKKKTGGESLPDYAFTEDEEEQLRSLIAIANKERNYIEDRSPSEKFLCPYEDYQTISELLREMVTEVVHQEMLPLMGFCSNSVSVEKS